jgi:periplasmic divalent cation tolerance protein
MTDKIVVLVTASSQEECEKIARYLVEHRLAACANITGPVRSIYRWEGKLQTQQEFLMLLKSTRELFESIQEGVLRLHSYGTPEVVCLPIIDGSPEYLNWITESVEQSG